MTLEVTSACQHCDGQIAFSQEMSGQRAACPHCGLETVLLVPPPIIADSEASRRSPFQAAVHHFFSGFGAVLRKHKTSTPIAVSGGHLAPGPPEKKDAPISLNLDAAYQRSLPASTIQKKKLSFFGCTWDGAITTEQAADALSECANRFPDAEAACLKWLKLQSEVGAQVVSLQGSGRSDKRTLAGIPAPPQSTPIKIVPKEMQSAPPPTTPVVGWTKYLPNAKPYSAPAPALADTSAPSQSTPIRVVPKDTRSAAPPTTPVGATIREAENTACRQIVSNESSFVRRPALQNEPHTDCFRTAVEEDDIEEAKSLLKVNPNLVFSRSYTGKTPLYIAATYGHTRTVTLLLKYGAKINAGQKQGTTPLNNAAAHGRKAVVKILVASGADVNAKDKDGETPLHWKEQ